MSDSPSHRSGESSVESSPNITRRFLPSHLRNTLPTSKQVIPVISDSDPKSDSDSESGDDVVQTFGQPPAFYYVSPSKPQKRRHLSVPSPKMARLSIFGHPRSFKPSIPGYGNVLKKTVRVPSTSFNGLGSRQVEWRGAKDTVLGEGMRTAIPVSELGLASEAPNTTLAGSTPRPLGSKCIQRLFEEPAVRKGNLVDGSPESPMAKVPIRRRIVLPRLKNIRMQYREPRSPIVISESDSSDEPSNDEEVPGPIAISRVVGEILGRHTSEGSEAGLFDDPIDVDNTLRARQDRQCPDEENSPLGFQNKEKSKELGKKDRDQQIRKDDVSNAKLAPSKIKEILRYPCCDNICLGKLGVEEVTKQRKYYYGLTHSEKNVLLRGCMEKSHQGRSGYNVQGKTFCREGFKRLYSVGNSRLQRISRDIFMRVQNDAVCKEKSPTQLSLVQWLHDFFSINVESLPNKDIFNLPDNWTKQEIFEAFKTDTLLRDETTTTYSWFCRIWNIEFPRVRIPKRSRFSTCAPCTEFKALRDKATLEAERSKCSQWEFRYQYRVLFSLLISGHNFFGIVGPILVSFSRLPS